MLSRRERSVQEACTYLLEGHWHLTDNEQDKTDKMKWSLNTITHASFIPTQQICIFKTAFLPKDSIIEKEMEIVTTACIWYPLTLDSFLSLALETNERILAGQVPLMHLLDSARELTILKSPLGWNKNNSHPLFSCFHLKSPPSTLLPSRSKSPKKE